VNAADLLRRVLAALDHTGIPHMLTGSFAASFHGAPRATQDLDLVIAPTAPQLGALAQQLPPGEFYFPLEAAQEALRNETMFNVIDLQGGWKVDCIIRKSRMFSRTEFDRRQTAQFLGLELAIATVEDVIVSKLEWAKRGGSQRQLEDVAELVRRRGSELDTGYLMKWIEALGLGQQWEVAKRLAAQAPSE